MDDLDDDPHSTATSGHATIERNCDSPTADQIEAVLMASNEDGCDVGEDGDEAGNADDSQGEDDDSEMDDDEGDEDDDDDDDDDDESEDGDGEPGDENEAGDLPSEEEGSSEDEETDDSNEDEEGTNEDNASACTASGMQLTSELVSDSDGDETAVRCPICLARLGLQCVGSPETCDHIFCLDCILEWAKNVNTCPVDRQTFSLVLVRQGVDGVIYRRVPVENRQLNVGEEEPTEDLTFCEVCGRADHEDRLLLCDGCDLGYHLDCLDPPLSSVPRGDWFCTDCLPRHVAAPVAEAPRQPLSRCNAGQASRSAFQIARTIMAERVRIVVARNRRQQRQATLTSEGGGGSLPSTSGSQQSAGSLKPATSRSGVRQQKKRRSGTHKGAKSTKRKKRRKIVRTKVKVLEDGTTVVVKTRRRRKIKRKGKGKKKVLKSARTKRLTPISTKTRLAGRLGIGLPPTGRTIPVYVKPSSASNDRSSAFFESRVASSSATELSILGNRDELDPFSASDYVSTDGGASDSRDKVTFKLSKRPTPLVSRSSDTSSSFDVLGDIMKSQSNLHRNLSDVVINRDGSLQTPVAAKSLAGQQPLRSSPPPSTISGNSNVTVELKKSQNVSGNWQPVGAIAMEFDVSNDSVTAMKVTQEALGSPAEATASNGKTVAMSDIGLLASGVSPTTELCNQEDKKSNELPSGFTKDSIDTGCSNSCLGADAMQDFVKSTPKTVEPGSDNNKPSTTTDSKCEEESKGTTETPDTANETAEAKVTNSEPQDTNAGKKTSADGVDSVNISHESGAKTNVFSDQKSDSRSREGGSQKGQKRSRSRSKGRHARGRRSRSKSGDYGRRDGRRSRSRDRLRDRAGGQRRSRSRDRSRRDQRRSGSRSRDRRERRSRSREQIRQFDKPRAGSPYRGRYFRDRRRSSSRPKEQLEQANVMLGRDGNRQRDRRRSRSRSRDRNRPRDRRRSTSRSRNQQDRRPEWEDAAAAATAAAATERVEKGYGAHSPNEQDSSLPGMRQPQLGDGHQSKYPEQQSQRMSPARNIDLRKDRAENRTLAERSNFGREFGDDDSRGGDKDDGGESPNASWQRSGSRQATDDCKGRISVISSGNPAEHGRRDSRYARRRDDSEQSHRADDNEEHRRGPSEYDPSVPTDEPSSDPPAYSFPPGMPPRGPPPFAWRPHERMVGPQFDNRLPPSAAMSVPMQNNPPPLPFFSRPPPMPIHQAACRPGVVPPAFGFVPAAAAGLRQPLMVEGFPARLPPPPPAGFQSAGGIQSASADAGTCQTFSIVRPPPPPQQQHPAPPQPPHVIRVTANMERPESLPLLIRGPVEFQSLPRFVIMPPPTMGQPVHISDPSRFAVCTVPQIPSNLVQLPVGQQPISHAPLVIGQQLIIPPPNASLQLRPDAASANQSMGPIHQLGISSIEQSSLAPRPMLVPPPPMAFDPEFARPPSSIGENQLDNAGGRPLESVTATTSQHLQQQQEYALPNNLVSVSAHSPSPSLSPTESDEMMAGEIFARHSGIDNRESRNSLEHMQTAASSSRPSFLQEIRSCNDDEHMKPDWEPAAVSGRSDDRSETGTSSSYANAAAIMSLTGMSQATGYEEKKLVGDVASQQNAGVRSSGPLDPRALLQYLLQQSRQATAPAVVSTLRDDDGDRPYGHEYGEDASERSVRNTSTGGFNPSSEVPIADPVDMDVDSQDTPQGKVPDVYSPSQADYVPTPPGNEQETVEKKRSKQDRMNRVVEAVKNALKPHYSHNKISKDEYKHIMRSAVPKICHSKSNDVDMERIQNFINVCVIRTQKARKPAKGPAHSSGKERSGRKETSLRMHEVLD